MYSRQIRKLVLVTALASAAGAQPVAAADDWYPSRWGKDDTLGAVNLITADSVAAAARLVKTGKRYALGMEVSRDTPAFGSRTVETFVVSNGAIFNNAGEPIGQGKVTGNDDWGLVFFGVGTQIDGLGHVGIDHTYYNGTDIHDFYHQSGLKKFSTSDIPPIVTRGVLIDVLGYLQATAPDKVMTVDGHAMLKPEVAINQAAIEGALARQGIALAKGDVVLLNTGYMALADSDAVRYMAAQPGLGKAGALYLAGFDPVAVGGDTFGLEIQPGEVADVYLPVHQELLAKRGIYILENIVTRELAADQAWEFMFVLGQARLKGTVQMIINPVALR
ncbi:MAG: cyclase family protein [Gammaproteobacteria bacterium]|nr:cyclase family protein [Gammaproteobacteria bacterium]